MNDALLSGLGNDWTSAASCCLYTRIAFATFVFANFKFRKDAPTKIQFSELR